MTTILTAQTFDLSLSGPTVAAQSAGSRTMSKAWCTSGPQGEDVAVLGTPRLATYTPGAVHSTNPSAMMYVTRVIAGWKTGNDPFTATWEYYSQAIPDCVTYPGGRAQGWNLVEKSHGWDGWDVVQLDSGVPGLYIDGVEQDQDLTANYPAQIIYRASKWWWAFPADLPRRPKYTSTHDSQVYMPFTFTVRNLYGGTAMMRSPNPPGFTNGFVYNEADGIWHSSDFHQMWPSFNYLNGLSQPLGVDVQKSGAIDTSKTTRVTGNVTPPVVTFVETTQTEWVGRDYIQVNHFTAAGDSMVPGTRSELKVVASQRIPDCVRIDATRTAWLVTEMVTDPTWSVVYRCLMYVADSATGSLTRNVILEWGGQQSKPGAWGMPTTTMYMPTPGYTADTGRYLSVRDPGASNRSNFTVERTGSEQVTVAVVADELLMSNASSPSSYIIWRTFSIGSSGVASPTEGWTKTHHTTSPERVLLGSLAVGNTMMVLERELISYSGAPDGGTEVSNWLTTRSGRSLVSTYRDWDVLRAGVVGNAVRVYQRVVDSSTGADTFEIIDVDLTTGGRTVQGTTPDIWTISTLGWGNPSRHSWAVDELTPAGTAILGGISPFEPNIELLEIDSTGGVERLVAPLVSVTSEDLNLDTFSVLRTPSGRGRIIAASWDEHYRVVILVAQLRSGEPVIVTVPPLRLAQRDDGLGSMKHARLPLGHSSRQSSPSPRLGVGTYE